MYTSEDIIDFKPINYILDKLVGYSDDGYTVNVGVFICKDNKTIKVYEVSLRGEYGDMTYFQDIEKASIVHKMELPKTPEKCKPYFVYVVGLCSFSDGIEGGIVVQPIKGKEEDMFNLIKNRFEKFDSSKVYNNMYRDSLHVKLK